MATQGIPAPAAAAPIPAAAAHTPAAAAPTPAAPRGLTSVPAPAAGPEASRLPPNPLITTHRIFEACDAQKKSLGLLHGDLFDSRPAVALSALAAVGKLGDTRSFPYVARLMAGAQEELQCACVRALGNIRHPDVPRLLRDLAKTTRTEKIRREILGALAASAPGDKDVAALIRHAARTPLGSAAAGRTRRACCWRLAARSRWKSCWRMRARRCWTR